MKKGTIKFYSEDRQYGFITPDGGGKEIYLHKKALEDEVRSGNRVCYELEENRKGLVAAKVHLEESSDGASA